MGLLWIVRNSKQPSRRIANAGVYHHSMNRESINGLIRIELPEHAVLYTEISGSQHRFSVRFMTWNSGDPRPVQTTDDIEFALTVC